MSNQQTTQIVGKALAQPTFIRFAKAVRDANPELRFQFINNIRNGKGGNYDGLLVIVGNVGDKAEAIMDLYVAFTNQSDPAYMAKVAASSWATIESNTRKAQAVQRRAVWNGTMHKQGA